MHSHNLSPCQIFQACRSSPETKISLKIPATSKLSRIPEAETLLSRPQSFKWSETAQTGNHLFSRQATCRFLDLGPGGENETAHTSPPCCGCSSCQVVVTTTLALHS